LNLIRDGSSFYNFDVTHS